MDVVCGIDVGTTHIKAVLLAESGDVLGIGRVNTPVERDQVGYCHDPDKVMLGVLDAVGAARRRTSVPVRIVGIGVTSFGEEGVAVDSRDRWLYPSIAWFDNRGSAGADVWARSIGETEVTGRTGLSIDRRRTLFKWWWMKEHVPCALKSMERWVGLGDFVIFKLCGGWAMSVSHASRTGVWDIWAHEWIAEWVDRVLPKGVAVLPRPVAAGFVVGGVVSGVAKELGAVVGAPVVVTGLDHVVGAFAVVGRGVESVVDSMGTAEAVVVGPIGDRELCRELAGGMELTAALDGVGVWLMGSMASGAFLGNLAQLFGEKIASLDDMARSVPLGAGGMRLRAPLLFGRGTSVVWRGWNEEASKAQIYRSALEGWSEAFVDCIRQVTQKGVKVSEVVGIGGGAKSRLWLEIKAAMLGLPIRRVVSEESAGAGAAVIAGRTVWGDHVMWRPTSEIVGVDGGRGEDYSRMVEE